MIPTFQDYLNVAPIIIVSATALLEIVFQIIFKGFKKYVNIFSILGLLISIYFAIINFDKVSMSFSNMVFSGKYASFFEILFCIIGILTILQSSTIQKYYSINKIEYNVLILISIVGMMVMSAGADLISIFIGLEIMSICFYVLAGFARNQIIANEASLKYFLLGAFATGFLLYGIALIYGTVGTTNIIKIAQHYPIALSLDLHLLGLILLLIGLAFKVALVPFHMWQPDVYEGAITNVSGLMASGGKTAAFASFLLIFSIPLAAGNNNLIEIVSVLAALSMIVGNIFGLVQQNIKRMLAYSSIAHTGYILVGIIATNNFGNHGALFYLVVYSITSVGAFGVASILENEFGKNLNINDYSGLSQKNKFLAFAMSVFMFSLIGIPPFAGFVGKYYLFAAAIQRDLTWLVILGVLTSIVSLYYYLRLIVYMYFRDPENQNNIIVTNDFKIAISFSTIVVILFGIYPSSLFSVIRYIFNIY
ncbi:MAG: NADH-quinone oxidoreductase subunit N [Bacteroidetes bacterium]|nr:NADH-quinone oxidoreductase subunit N [Bacteroidota bacterium]